jgi:segregation and condensation protein A
MEDRIYDIILSKDLTWEGLIRDIVKEENMDPWDINISKLSSRYLEYIKGLNRIDFKLTGKFLLTASILLKMKSDALTTEELIRPDYYLYDLAGAIDLNKVFERPTVPDDIGLTPKISPQRSRRVTLDELVNALRGAMEVQDRRDVRHERMDKIKRMREVYKPINISEKIKVLYKRIVDFFKKLGKKQVTFAELSPSKDKKDIIWTFLPLLHLSNDGKIELEQDKEFGDIYVRQPEKNKG